MTVLALSVLGLQVVPSGSRAAAGLQGFTRGHVGGPEVVPRAIAQLYEELWVWVRGERQLMRGPEIRPYTHLPQVEGGESGAARSAGGHGLCSKPQALCSDCLGQSNR